MKTTVSVYDFRNAFQQVRPNNFSYEGLSWLFDYFEEYENSCDEEIELDVIAICCDFSESTYEEIIESYGIEIDPSDSTEDQKKQVRDFLDDETIVIGYDDEKVVFRQF
jgi:hypothetical protein